MNKNYRLAAFYLVALITCGAIFGCLIVGFAAIPNNTIRQNAGAVMPTFNATGAGYFVGPNMVISATRAATFVTVDTGQGANELYDMDQNVLTTSPVQFLSVNATQYYAGPNNVTDIFYFPETEASYIIFTQDVGGVPYYYAKNGTSGLVTSNANKTTLVQTVINACHSAGGGRIHLVNTNLPYGLLYYVDVIISDNKANFQASFTGMFIPPKTTTDLAQSAQGELGGDMCITVAGVGKSTICSPVFTAYGDDRIFREDESGDIVLACTFNTAVKGGIRSVGINVQHHYLIIAGLTSPYTAYYYLSEADVNADNVNAQMADVYPSHLAHGGIRAIYTDASIRGFIWAEYEGAGDHRIIRVTQAGVGAAVFSTVLTQTQVEASHFHSIDYDISNPGTMYATTGDSGARIKWFISTDYGVTWALVPGASGNQKYRTLRIGFTSDYLYWNTDTKNSVFDGYNCELIRAPRNNLTDITILAQFEYPLMGYGLSYNWEPYGFLLILKDTAAAPAEYLDRVPLYFYSLVEDRLYQIYGFTSLKTGTPGLHSSTSYQSLNSGKIYITTNYVYSDPLTRYTTERRRVYGVRISGGY